MAIENSLRPQAQIDDLRLKCFIGAQNLKIKSTGRSPCFVK